MTVYTRCAEHTRISFEVLQNENKEKRLIQSYDTKELEVERNRKKNENMNFNCNLKNVYKH